MCSPHHPVASKSYASVPPTVLRLVGLTLGQLETIGVVAQAYRLRRLRHELLSHL
jgi:hypothetical protein